MQSHPLRVRELKLHGSIMDFKRPSSHPLRVRELKLLLGEMENR